MKIVLVLTGVHAGKNIVLGGKQFVNGQFTAIGQHHELDALTRYMARTYEAFPSGTDELIAAQARDAKRKGQTDGVQREVHPRVEDAGAERVRSGGASAAGGLPPQAAVGSAGDELRSAAGTPGLVPGGSGHADAGVHPDEVNTIRVMLRKLDPEVDDQWSAEGLPSVESLAAALNKPDLSRAMLDFAAPGFTRERARELKAEQPPQQPPATPPAEKPGSEAPDDI